MTNSSYHDTAMLMQINHIISERSSGIDIQMQTHKGIEYENFKGTTPTLIYKIQRFYTTAIQIQKGVHQLLFEFKRCYTNFNLELEGTTPILMQILKVLHQL